MVGARPGRAARARARRGSSRCSAPRASRSRSTSRRTGRAGTPRRGAGRRERPAALPVLRRRAPSSASASGAARSSPPVALPRLQLLLRGAPRGLRRPRRATTRPRRRAAAEPRRAPRASGSSPAPARARGRGARGTRHARATAASRCGSMVSGRSGSRKGNLRHSCTSSVWARNIASGVFGPQPAELRDEPAVGRGDAVEVPRVRDHARGIADRAQLGAEREQLGDGSVARHVAQPLLALDVRRDPQPAAERAEALPREPRAHPMADLATLLGHAQHDQQPAPLPLPRVAEAVDPLGARRSASPPCRRLSRHARSPAVALGRSQPAVTLRASAWRAACVL